MCIRDSIGTSGDFDRAILQQPAIDDGFRGDDFRAQLPSQGELRFDASLGTKKSRARLEVADLIAAQTKLRIAMTQFVGAQDFMCDAELLGRGDSVLDKRSRTVMIAGHAG